MTDFIQDVRDYFADRFSSPFWISFIASWMIINWKLPITAIFETEKFNVAFISLHLEQTDISKIFYAPLLIAFLYAILSGSIKETIDILSKLIRSLFSHIDRKGFLYKSISLIEHQKQISRLDRQLNKMEKDKEELTELSAENSKLENTISELKIELKEKLDYHNQNSILAQENDSLVKKLNKIDEYAKNNLSIIERAELLKIIGNTQEKQKTDTADTADTADTYFEKIKKYCSKKLNDSLKETNSRSSLMLILDLIDNNKAYTIEELRTKSGISKDFFLKAFNLASQAQLIGSTGSYAALTPAGKNKIEQLKNDEELAELNSAISKIDIETKDEIIFQLKEKAMSLSELKVEINFNQHIKQLLDELIKEKRIHKEGSIFFINS